MEENSLKKQIEKKEEMIQNLKEENNYYIDYINQMKSQIEKLKEELKTEY